MNRIVLLVGVLSAVLGALMVGRLLAEYEWDPSVTIRFGEAFPEQNAYAESLLGEIRPIPDAGHDGKFFFSQALDPFYLNPSEHAVHLDRPAYRAQRMLYPTVAGLGGLAPPVAAAWGLILVNVIATGVGAAITARISVEMGLSAWFGLAFVLNPGVFFDLVIDGAGIVALAALLGGALFHLRGRWLAAAVVLSLAALARETMLIGVAGLAVAYWHANDRRIPWLYAAPAVSVGAWWFYVHLRLGADLTQDTQALGPPFRGLVEAFQVWLSEPGHALDLAIGSLLVAISVGLAYRAVSRPSVLGWATVGFGILGIFLSEPVWYRYFDSTRAVAPVVTGYILVLASSVNAQSPASVAISAGAHGSETGSTRE